MKDRLVSPSYCYILAANFLLYFGFYILMPVLPFYLTEVFGLGKGAIGTILACYTVAALIVRPFSGYLLDAFARKPLYLLAFTVFTSVFGLYLVAGTVLLFVALRIVIQKGGRHRLLRTCQQYCDVPRPDDRPVPA